MTTFISSEALWNYIKDIWKIISEFKKKNHATFHQILNFFYISAFGSLTDRPTDNFFYRIDASLLKYEGNVHIKNHTSI